ncbi:MAG: hypothetical protein IMZ71_01535 [Chloroflexi bacterium]|nr:hypothetical protein [Chloroflexota bacterium]
MVKVTIHGQHDDAEVHADTRNGATWIGGSDPTSAAMIHVRLDQARQIATMLCRAFDFTAADLGIEQAAPVSTENGPANCSLCKGTGVYACDNSGHGGRCPTCGGSGIAPKPVPVGTEKE